METPVDNVIGHLETLPDDKFNVMLDRLLDMIDGMTDRKSPEVKEHFKEHCRRIWGIEPTEQSSLPFASVQAKQLQEISGLAVEQLAEIFAIPEAKYQQWLAGLPPTGKYRQQLLEVLVQVAEASTRLKTPETMNDWLLAIAYDGGKRPLDYLAAGEYRLFRVLFLRIRTGQEAFLPPLPRKETVNPFMTEEDFEDALERARPRVYLDDEDYDIDESRVDMTQKIPLRGDL